MPKNCAVEDRPETSPMQAESTSIAFGDSQSVDVARQRLPIGKNRRQSIAIPIDGITPHHALVDELHVEPGQIQRVARGLRSN